MSVVDCKVFVGEGSGLSSIPNIIPIDVQEKWESLYESLYERLELKAEDREIDFEKFAEHILRRHPWRILQAALAAGLYEEQEVDFDLLDHKAQGAVEEEEEIPPEPEEEDEEIPPEDQGGPEGPE